MEIEKLYRQYGSMVYRRCLQLLRNQDEAIDAMQEVFVKLLQMQPVQIRSPSSLLYVVATRHCLNRIRSKRRRSAQTNVLALAHAVAHIPDSSGASHAKILLRRLFRRGPETSGVIAILHFLDGLTLEETAFEVGMSVSGVRRRIRVLRRQLQELEVSL